MHADLKKLGYTIEQAHLLLSAAVRPAHLACRLLSPAPLITMSPQPCQSHVGAIVDVPNACVTMSLPTQIFDRDITPNGMGPDGFEKRDYGQCAIRSDGQRGVDIFDKK